MPKEPEEMLPEQWVATLRRLEKRCIKVAVEIHQNRANRNTWEREDDQKGCNELSPHKERHTIEFHARRAKVEDRNNDVERAKHRADTQELETQHPKIHTITRR